jgi:hypothetical protein
MTPLHCGGLFSIYTYGARRGCFHARSIGGKA